MLLQLLAACVEIDSSTEYDASSHLLCSGLSRLLVRLLRVTLLTYRCRVTVGCVWHLRVQLAAPLADIRTLHLSQQQQLQPLDAVWRPL